MIAIRKSDIEKVCKTKTMKTPTQQFMETARKGGIEIPINWNEPHIRDGHIARTLINPKAWKAVGKELGWNKKDNPYYAGYEWSQYAWENNIHRFLDHLIEGKTIDDSLADILQVDKEDI